MHDWKSTYGVSDAGAAAAGIYGTPSSTYDISVAQTETMRLAVSPQPDYSYVPPAPVFETSTFGSAVSSGSHGVPIGGYAPYKAASSRTPVLGRRGWLVMAGILAVATMSVVHVGALVILAAPHFQAFSVVRVSALDTDFYREHSPDAAAWSSISTSRLYAAHLNGRTSEWGALDANAQRAVKAAWIRYTIDPASFERLPAAQRGFVIATFDSYLVDLASQGVAQADADLKYLRASPFVR